MCLILLIYLEIVTVPMVAMAQTAAIIQPSGGLTAATPKPIPETTAQVDDGFSTSLQRKIS